MQGRCMKCKENKDMKETQIVKTARGGFMAKGKCLVCDCGMCKILSEENANKAMNEGEAKKAF